MKFSTVIAVLCAWALNGALPASGYIDYYLPQGLKSRTVVAPQKILFSDIGTNKQLNAGGVQLINDADGCVLKGKSKDGKEWIVERDPIGLGGSLYQCDLDGDGQQDLLLVTNTGACGIAPSQQLCVILFDNKHAPRCFVMTGYYTETKRGLQDLVVPKGGKTPVLLQQQLVWAKTSGRDNSYWRWQSYRAQNGVFKPVNGVIGGVKMPCYVFYRNKGNTKVSPLSDLLEKQTKTQHNDAKEVSATAKR